MIDEILGTDEELVDFVSEIANTLPINEIEEGLEAFMDDYQDGEDLSFTKNLVFTLMDVKLSYYEKEY